RRAMVCLGAGPVLARSGRSGWSPAEFRVELVLRSSPMGAHDDASARGWRDDWLLRMRRRLPEQHRGLTVAGEGAIERGVSHDARSWWGTVRVLDVSFRHRHRLDRSGTVSLPHL